MASKQKIVCVLYDGPVGGYRPQYARQDIPLLAVYPAGGTMLNHAMTPHTSGISLSAQAR